MMERSSRKEFFCGGELSHTCILRNKRDHWERCRNMQINLCVSLFQSGGQKERERLAAAILLQTWLLEHTDQDHFHLLLLTNDHLNITSVFSIIYDILNQFRKHTIQPNFPYTFLDIQKSEHFSSYQCGVIYCLYFIN